MSARLSRPVSLLLIVGALVLGAGLVAPAVARGPERPVTLAIRLVAAPGIPDTHGSAVFHARSGERSLTVRLDATPRLGGETVVVMLGSRAIGRIALNERGNGRLVLSTAAGDQVPASVYGLPLRIVAPGGTVIAAGQFPPAP